MSDEKYEDSAPGCVAERERAVELVRHELGRLVRESGRTQRAIERDNDFARGYLSQVLHGHMALTARHVFGVLAALDVPPADFFGRLFPSSAAEEESLSEIRQRLARYDSALEELEEKGLLSPKKGDAHDEIPGGESR